MPPSRFRPLLAALALLAGVCAARPAPAQHSPEEAQHFIQALADQAIASVAAQQIPDSERTERFRQLFVASFDLPEISRFVLARYWKLATPEQQQDFIKLFEELQVQTWTQRFKSYKGESLLVTASVKDGEHAFTVDSQMMRAPSPPLPVQWHLHDTDDGKLMVTDIIIEGASMAITQRSDYNALLQSNGGKFDALLAALRAKIDQMRTN